MTGFTFGITYKNNLNCANHIIALNMFSFPLWKPSVQGKPEGYHTRGVALAFWRAFSPIWHHPQSWVLTPSSILSGSLSSLVNIGDDSGIPTWLKGAWAGVKNLGQAADHNRQIMGSAFSIEVVRHASGLHGKLLLTGREKTKQCQE